MRNANVILPKEAITDVEQIRNLVHERNELAKFVNKFLENFVDCEYCAETGDGHLADTDCRICHGTGKHIDSIGILYVELPNEARKLLGK